jgi:hypothetical protein
MSVTSNSDWKRRNAYKISALKPEEKTALDKTTRKRDVLTLILNKRRLKWIEWTQSMYQWHAETNLMWK